MSSHRTTLIAACAGALMISTVSHAAWFMKINSISGDAKDPQHQGWVEVMSFSWGMSQTGTMSASGRNPWAARSSATTISDSGNAPSAGGTCNGVGAAGTARIVKVSDKASPKLQKALAQGSQLGEVTIEETGNAGSVGAHYLLSNTMISGFTPGSGGDRPTESISLNFTKIEWEKPGCGGQPAPGSTTRSIPSPSTAPAPWPTGH